MASRASRKSGTHRMDGAIAALTPLGFSKNLICSTITELRKAYGDEDAAWYFVEENYYKLVIDNIIEKQDKEKEKQDAKKQEAEKKALVQARTPETCKQAILKLEAEDINSSGISKIEGHSNSSCLVRRPCYGWISDDED